MTGVEVPVVRIFTRHGQRMVAVAPCPYCSGQHQHLWRPGDQEPGSRVAPCTHGSGSYTMRLP